MSHLSKAIFFLIFTAFQIHLLGQSTSKPINISPLIDSIWTLKPIQDKNNDIFTKSEGKRKLSILIYKTAKETNKGYYWIKVGEENGSNFVSHFNFYVYPANNQIMFFDAINTAEIPLKKWLEHHDE